MSRLHRYFHYIILLNPLFSFVCAHNRDNKNHEEEIKKQKLVRNVIIGGLVVILTSGLFVLRSNIERRKSNKQLAEKNALVEQ